MKKENISRNVIRRLPRYLRTLDSLLAEGTERISSKELGRRLGFTPSQIRQDFSCFGEFGQQGYGYNVRSLRDEIGRILGMDRKFSVILIGAGRIGQSLIENFNFEHFGFRLIGAFEIRKELVGTKIAGVTIGDAEDQDAFIKANDVDIAILSINRGSTQRVAEELIASGVKAIWNFTDAEIDPGDSGVIIENIHFSDSLLALSYYLSQRGKED